MYSKRHATKEKQSDSSTSRGIRGATMSKEVTKAITRGVKFDVEWDDDGQAIGLHPAELKSYIGTTIKRLVAITFSDWRNVPQALKDMVWKEVLYYSKKDKYIQEEIDQIRVEWLEFFSEITDN